MTYPKMTKKHYYLLANTIKRNVEKQNTDKSTLYEFTRDLCYELSNTNPAFNRNRFMAVSGFKQ